MCIHKCHAHMKNISHQLRRFAKRYDTGPLGDIGRGAGKGGGAGGSIREAGGPFGKAGAAREEEYFYKTQRQLLMALKSRLTQENCLREAEIEEHEHAIKQNNEIVKELDERVQESITKHKK